MEHYNIPYKYGINQVDRAEGRIEPPAEKSLAGIFLREV